MKTYRLVLESYGVVFVDADSVHESRERLIFYREGIPVAEYARATVSECAESEATHRCDLYGHRMELAETGA